MAGADDKKKKKTKTSSASVQKVALNDTGKSAAETSPKMKKKTKDKVAGSSITSGGNSSSSSNKATTSNTKSALSPRNSPKKSAKKSGIQWRGRDSIAQIQRISRLSNFSEDEIIAVWGDSEEFKLRKDELRRCAVEMVQGRRESDVNFTTLGLEDKVGEGKKLKNYIRKKARNAVLDEQEYQAQEGAIDPEILADIYYETALPADIRARNKALQIHNEVEQLRIMEGPNGDEKEHMLAPKSKLASAKAT